MHSVCIRTAPCHHIHILKLRKRKIFTVTIHAEFATSCDAYKFIWLHIINSLFRLPSFRKTVAVHCSLFASIEDVEPNGEGHSSFFSFFSSLFDNINSHSMFCVVPNFFLPVCYYLDTADDACITCKVMYNIYILYLCQFLSLRFPFIFWLLFFFLSFANWNEISWGQR